MITKNKTKNGSSALVISMMCAVIMTIIWQSINTHTYTYAGISSPEPAMGSERTYGTAPVDAPTLPGSSHVLDDITLLVLRQKELVDHYLAGLQTTNSQDTPYQAVVQTGTSLGTQTQAVLSGVSEYLSFDTIKKSLSDRQCTYTLPIDNTDIKHVAHIQRALEHCLITVSGAHKVYPDDVLTHEMMRTIAQRAGFRVKMEYASRKPVSRAQFLTFFYALQQHHQLGDLPVVSMSTPLRRSEYIQFLHILFGDLEPQVTTLTGSVSTGSTVVFSSGAQATTTDIRPISSLQTSSQGTGGIGLDKQMMKQTLTWIVQQL